MSLTSQEITNHLVASDKTREEISTQMTLLIESFELAKCQAVDYHKEVLSALDNDLNRQLINLDSRIALVTDIKNKLYNPEQELSDGVNPQPPAKIGFFGKRKSKTLKTIT